MRKNLILILALQITLPACYDPQLVARLDDLEKQFARLVYSNNELRKGINDGLNMALCTPELSQLLDDVQKECTPATTALAADEDASCTTKQIRGAVIAADPDHKGRFLKLMSHVRHEVLYFSEGAVNYAPFRQDRLNRLSHQALLHNTRFLVVSSPEGGGDKEATRRANIVIKELVKNNMPRKIIQRWIYAFPAEKRDIERMNDLPGIGETQQLNRGVWVFRADC